MPTSLLPKILQDHQDALIQDWMARQLASAGRRLSPSDENALAANAREFLTLLNQAFQSGEIRNVHAPAWAPVREFLGSLSASRAKEGFTPSETAAFVFSLKAPAFARLSAEIKDPGQLISEIWNLSLLLDTLASLPPRLTRRPARPSSPASSASCWSFLPPWFACGTTFWPFP